MKVGGDGVVGDDEDGDDELLRFQGSLKMIIKVMKYVQMLDSSLTDLSQVGVGYKLVGYVWLCLSIWLKHNGWLSLDCNRI